MSKELEAKKNCVAILRHLALLLEEQIEREEFYGDFDKSVIVDSFKLWIRQANCFCRHKECAICSARTEISKTFNLDEVVLDAAF